LFSVLDSLSSRWGVAGPVFCWNSTVISVTKLSVCDGYIVVKVSKLPKIVKLRATTQLCKSARIG
jgi:hypothetical protein